MDPIVLALIGAVLQATIQGLFERIVPRNNVTELFLGKFLPNHGNNKILFQNLRTALQLVEKALTDDAVEKQLTSQTNREWVERLTDAVNQTADLLDEIYSQVLAKSHPIGESALHGIIQNSKDKLEEMTKSLEDIAKLKDVHGSKESSSKKKSLRLESTSLVESEVYGRDEDIKKIRNFLVEKSDQGDGKESDLRNGEEADQRHGKESGQRNGMDIPLIAIIGMAGIGKTTLAQLLFNHSDVESFSPRAWVHVSEDMDVLKVTKTLYEKVTDQTSDIQNLDTLQVKLVEKLKNKKFLFVFDDVWNEHHHTWVELQKVWKSGAPESRIIVTTRSQEVASTMHASQTHHLQPLNDEDCRKLFAKQAFGSPHIDAPLKLKPIAQDIIKKCGGLPLVARELGSLLYSKVDVEEWENISNSNLFDLSNNKIDILALFRFSFNHLSSLFLKQCFAYCSIIPKGQPFDREKLILLWKAQGFLLQLNSGGEMEQLQLEMERVGIAYFKELLAKSFFQQASDDDKSLLVMHNLINELAQFASTIQSCLVEKGKSPNISDKTRHVSYVCDGHDQGANLVDVLSKAKSLWTFLQSSLLRSSTGSSSIGTEVVKELWKQKRLRVLSLTCRNDKLPDEFGQLRHLRYLDLSHSEIKNLPETISSLYTLQTLILSHCTNLEKLPGEMADLIYLGHLDLTGTTALKMMPPAIGKLKSLRVLTNFVVSNSPEASSIKELGDLLLLCGKLSILELQNVSDKKDVEHAKLKEKNVKELEFEWSSFGQCGQGEVLEKLWPHEDIEKLSIAGYGGTSLPKWLGDSSFSKMVILRLRNCINCLSLPSLGQLSSLQQLYVSNLPNCKKLLSSAVTGAYPSLQELYVWKCGELILIPNCLPKLELLSIKECRNLRIDKLRNYPALQTLHIWSCDYTRVLRLNFFSNLKYLELHDCNRLKAIVFSKHLLQQVFNCLQKLDITDCPNLKSFSGTVVAPNLTTFSVSKCNKLRSMLRQMHMLTSLQTLNVSGCPELVSFPDGGLPLSLLTLAVKNCANLTPHAAWGLRNMESLTHLIIDCANVHLFPANALLPASLTHLQIVNFNGLKTLNLEGLRHLTLLKSLHIIDCNQLEILTDGFLPRSLSDLMITGCALLTEHCRKNQGKYWYKISHIPNKSISSNALS